MRISKSPEEKTSSDQKKLAKLSPVFLSQGNLSLDLEILIYSQQLLSHKDYGP